MVLYGVDIHPGFQAGISIEQIAKEVDFLSVKLSEGMSSSWVGMGSANWINRGKAAGLVCMGYHYLQPGSVLAQARLFADALRHTGVAGVLDAEAITRVDGRTVPTLTINTIRTFMSAARQEGAHIPLMYLPKWYHDMIGKPSLAGLPPLWASSYPSTQTGRPDALYRLVSAQRWASYGGLPVSILQFTDRGLVAHRAIDVNAYPGTKAQLASLVSPRGANPAGTTRKDRAEMIHLPATARPADPASDPSTWQQRNFNVGWNITGGWEGDAAWSFGVQDWGGPPTGKRGFLYLASWILPGDNGGVRLIPVDPMYTTGRGRTMHAHDLTPEYLAPKGCIGVTVNYAAPEGAYVAVGRSG